ncbi:MAG: glycosyltransferase, partial [Thiohalocapsa sp.]
VLQLLAAHLLDELADAGAAVATWRGILARFPRSRPAFLGLVAALRRQSGRRAAGAFAGSYCAGDGGFEALSARAEAWTVIGDEAQAAAAYRRLASAYPDRHAGAAAATAWLTAYGRYREAVELLTAIPPGAACDWHRSRRSTIEDTMARLPPAASPARLSRRRRHSLTVLGAVLADIVGARNALLPPTATIPKSVVMVIGSLGAGGAERQLVKTASGLNALRFGGSGQPVFPGLKIVAQSCRTRRNDGFFRGELSAAGIPVVEYEQLPLYGGDYASSAVRALVAQLRFLPVSMVEAILRVSDALRRWRPDVVEIWQEATIFDTALAALLARVPRLILCLRSVPPIDRPEMYKPEYPVLFRALAAAANVTFSCNSRFAAGRYAAWLDIDPDRIRVVPNGVELPSSAGDEKSAALYRRFAERTGDGAVTIGVVMRMDVNKRPLLWIETAARILEQLPAARFILVGDGPLRCDVMRWVAERGIAERFLFAGISSNIGFWLSKMDLFMLLSKQEGLPNVLIEAQLQRVPVLVTEAGGAPEAVVHGVTGLVTKPDPSADEAAAAALDLVMRRDRARCMGEAGERWARQSFSPARMLREQVALLAQEDPDQLGVALNGAAAAERGGRRL